MRISRRTKTERDVVAAFRAGVPLDLRGRRNARVRSEVIRFLLLGGAAAEAGTLPLLWLKGARVTGPLEVSARHLTARELVLLPTGRPEGGVDLSHARVGVLRDDPATWPTALCLDGFVYGVLDGEPTDRRPWLRLDSDRFRPRAYAQLARTYREAGRDDDARTVLLAGERHRREGLRWPGRWWGRLQDLTIGYGYRPLRAAAWLAALLAIGTAVFGAERPRPADAAGGPEFAAPVYTLDLIVPVVDFGQQSAFHPRGATAWLAYALIVAGLLLVTTITAAGARRLRRN